MTCDYCDYEDPEPPKHGPRTRKQDAQINMLRRLFPIERIEESMRKTYPMLPMIKKREIQP